VARHVGLNSRDTIYPPFQCRLNKKIYSTSIGGCLKSNQDNIGTEQFN
jgi:hypothetical protein